MDWITIEVLGVIFVATFIRSAFGFGEALVAVPLLALLIPIKVAVPLVTVLSITVATVILIQDWRHIHAPSAGWLILSTMFGIPLGLFVLKEVAEPIVKATLALIILAFAIYCLLSRRPFELKTDKLAWIFGFVAGILGGAYGMNGPPLVIYGTLRCWTPQQFRATLQGYFLPASMVGLGGYWLGGLWGDEAARYFLFSLPLALAAIFLGRIVNRRLNGRRFLLYVYCGLMVIGAILLIQSLSKPTMRR